MTGVVEGDSAAMKALTSSFDFILSTIPEEHDLNPYVPLLKRDKTLCVVGALEPPAPVNNMQVAGHCKSVAGSLIGNLADTQEVLDFCAEHGIGPDIQVIPIQEINDAYKPMEKADVQFRYVIDMASLKQEMETPRTPAPRAMPARARVPGLERGWGLFPRLHSGVTGLAGSAHRGSWVQPSPRVCEADRITPTRSFPAACW